MSSVDVDRETITAFEFIQTYLFKQYSNKDDLSLRFHGCYNSDRYWFKAPEGEFLKVKQILDSFFYELKIADKPLDYCVVQVKKRDSSAVLRNSAATPRQGKYEIFIMKDNLSARQAIERGATPIQKPGLSLDQKQWENRWIIAESGGYPNGRFKYLA